MGIDIEPIPTWISITAKHVPKTISIPCANLSIDQQFDPTWATEQAYGKMDPIATFSHTGRKALFKLELLATNAEEGKLLQSNVDQLIKFQYPRYTGTTPGGIGSSLAAPPFFDITVLGGKLYNTMSGYIHAFNIVPGHVDGTSVSVDDNGNFLERSYNINFTMTVLHTHVVGYIDNEEPGGDRGFIFTSATEAARQSAASPTRPAAQSSLLTIGATQGATADTSLAAVVENVTPPETSVET